MIRSSHNKTKAETLAVVKECLDDGWSQIEIYRTHKIHPMTIRKYFPGSGWTMKQGSEMGAVVRNNDFVV